jgi:hypothetical protein
MDLTIGSLNFCVRSLGTTRLSDPTKSGPSAEKIASATMLESSVGSSSEINSLVSFTPTDNIGDATEELDEIMDNLDLGEPSGDFMICHNGTSDKSTNTWKTGLELHEDDETIFSSFSSKINHKYQVCAIIGDNSQEFDDNHNPVLNPANITRGANHLAEGDTADSLTTRVKVRLSANEWNIIKAAIDNGAAIPVDASKDVLSGYHYALHRQAIQLAKRNKEKERISKCSKQSYAQSTQQRIIYKQQKA